MQGVKLSLEDLHIGDIVSSSSLEEIYNVYVTLVDSKIIDGDIVGRIAFIGQELGAESDYVVETNDKICAIYHNRAEVEGEETCDEQLQEYLNVLQMHFGYNMAAEV